MANVADASWEHLRNFQIHGVTIDEKPDRITIAHTPPFWKQKASRKSNPGRAIVGLAWFGPALLMLISGNPLGAFFYIFAAAIPAFLIMAVIYKAKPASMSAVVRVGQVTLDDSGSQTAAIAIGNIKNIDVRPDKRGLCVYVWDGVVPFRAFIVDNNEEGVLIKELLVAAIAKLNGRPGAPKTVSGPSRTGKFEE